MGIAGHQQGDLIGVHRPAEVVALPDVAAVSAQPVSRLGILHALGDDGDAEGVRQLDHRAHDCRGAGVGGDRCDEVTELLGASLAMYGGVSPSRPSPGARPVVRVAEVAGRCIAW